jgi:hypothetical protein
MFEKEKQFDLKEMKEIGNFIKRNFVICIFFLDLGRVVMS